MRIANIAALILATTSFPAFAQRSGGHVERKPSPATSAVSTSSSPSGAQAAPSLQPAINPYRANSGSSAPAAIQPVVSRPAAPAPLARPVQAIPAPRVAPQPAPTSIAASVPASIPQPVSPAPSPEPMAAVNYTQGQLTVVSQSASLGTVLKLISAKTGAVIDLAPELQNEPVIAQIGPSAVREVMTALLDSPKIDYIIMGSGNVSGGMERILVRTRQSFGRNVISMSRPPQASPAEAAEFKFATGVPAAGVAKPQTQLTQEQMMENWKKIREDKKLAEIEKQRQDRENEENRVEPPPQPEPQTQPEPQPNNNADNPPLN
jgi:hypothetical protein